MDILNKIGELTLQGYTVTFKPSPEHCICMEMTYLHYYHTFYVLTLPCDVPSDRIMMLLDEMKKKIDRMVEERNRQWELKPTLKL